MWPGHAADHSPPSSAAIMEGYSYTSTHRLGHTGPVTGSLYLYLYVRQRSNISVNNSTYKHVTNKSQSTNEIFSIY